MLVRAYLAFPPAWLVMGKQTLYVGTRAMTGSAPAELAIILPVYNEGEAGRPAVLRSMAAGVTTPHELVVVYDFDGDTTVPGHRAAHLRAARVARAAQRPGSRGAQRDEGGDRRHDGAVRPDLDGRRLGRAARSWTRWSSLARSGADVVAASRYMRGGHQVGGPRLKRLMSRTAGLTLHWFAGVPTHDPTNNFKLYSRRFLESVTIESSAGFELALELTVKATIARRRVAEVPTTWRDRTAGQSNFKLRKWLPHYLHWYRVAFAARLRRRGR